MPSIQRQVRLYDEYLHDVGLFLTKQLDLAELRGTRREVGSSSNSSNNKMDHASLVFWGEPTRTRRENNECPLATNHLPERIATLYQQGRCKIALEKIRDSTAAAAASTKDMSHDHDMKFRDASDRQMALYEQGVAKIRQQRMSSSSSISRRENDGPAVIRKKADIFSNRNNYSSRQISLYIMGVNKLRERKRQEVAHQIKNQELSKCDSDYYKRLYQRLHNLVAKIENPIPLFRSETLSTEIKENPSSPSYDSRHGKALFDLSATNGIAGILSTLPYDFPEIHDLCKSGAGTLRNEKKAAMNLSKLCSRSKHLLLQSSTKTVIRKEVDESFFRSATTKSRQHNDVHVNKYALAVGLRGIVIQYLEDTVKEIERNRLLKKCDITSENIYSIEGVESSNNQLIIELLSQANEEEGNQRSIVLEEASCKSGVSSHSAVSSGWRCRLELSSRSSSSTNCNGIEVFLAKNYDNLSRETTLPIYQQYNGRLLVHFDDAWRRSRENVVLAATDLMKADEKKQSKDKMQRMSSRPIVIRKITTDAGDIELCVL
eukprot:CAMPEP_0176495648 /NCGR_PEP_ID=MMETSP0200_2-20121128/10772_1 /TAXON_ID=947934 /ORGANISM="Chaetoceros sp., Strain GSL56" /LENGTH=545 /DNA_ID=CAMNT_0017893547 /DNA_START=365 /DNA_END=2002 /DNA_ORIENTATION=-